MACLIKSLRLAIRFTIGSQLASGISFIVGVVIAGLLTFSNKDVGEREYAIKNPPMKMHRVNTLNISVTSESSR